MGRVLQDTLAKAKGHIPIVRNLVVIKDHVSWDIREELAPR
jgi:hypothetical protein